MARHRTDAASATCEAERIVKNALLLLLTAFSIAARAQDGYAGPFSEGHIQEKQSERIAIGLRVQQNLRIARDRDEARYAENRRRCRTALRVAELCGKFAGTFFCDEKGFQRITVQAPIEPARTGNGDRYKMERCALDAAKRDR